MKLEQIIIESKIPIVDKKLLILLHGVGANEKSLLEFGELLAPDSIKVSLRAPLSFGPTSFGWFHVQFTPSGPVHNWEEAQASFKILEEEIISISEQFKIPLNKISLFGFSQGSIMTMGLALNSKLKLENYLCFSGRTLPEFSAFALEHQDIALGRCIYLAHGIHDDKLPIMFAQQTKELLARLGAVYKYKEFPGGHEIPLSVINDAKIWMRK